MMNTSVLFERNRFQTKIDSYKEKNIIWIQFEKDYRLIEMLKKFTKPIWSQSQKSWYVVDNPFNRELFELEKKIVGKEVLMKIHANNVKEFQKFQDLIVLKGFSPNTLRTYSMEFAQLLYIIKSFPVEELSKEKLQSYFLYCHKELQLSENQIHSRMNAVKFYFEKVLHKEKMFFDIPRPKKPQLLPIALNTAEISSIITST